MMVSIVRNIYKRIISNIGYSCPTLVGVSIPNLYNVGDGISDRLSIKN